MTGRLKDGVTQASRDYKKTERWSNTSRQRLQKD